MIEVTCLVEISFMKVLFTSLMEPLVTRLLSRHVARLPSTCVISPLSLCSLKLKHHRLLARNTIRLINTLYPLLIMSNFVKYPSFGAKWQLERSLKSRTTAQRKLFQVVPKVRRQRPRS